LTNCNKQIIPLSLYCRKNNLQQQTNHINNLINRCLQNEQAAYYEVYNNYHQAMYNSAYRILQDSMEAEDVMQESFIKAFEKLSSFKRKSRFSKNTVPFGSWLKRIVINNSINQLRNNKKFNTTELENVKEVVDTDETVEIDTNEVTILLEALEKLKPNYKLALTLHLIEGYDYEEISEIMQITNQNARTIISRAKNKLKTLLKYKDASQQI